jgi:DNA polymerase III subunit delta
MPTFKPAYLIHGDAHARISERRARLRAIAEQESGVSGVETFEGDQASPEVIAGALMAMTFAVGRRFVIVDGAERWSEADVSEHLAPALAGLAPDTTVAFFAREDGRAKVPAGLAAAVKRAGGDVAPEQTPKARELPKWAIGEATRLGVTLDAPGAQALVARVGDRQSRLLRELEKLAIEHGAGARLGVDEVQDASAVSAELEIWGLVDALVAGDGASATRAFLALRAQGEALPRLVPSMVRRVRDVLAIALRLTDGEAPAQIKSSLRMSPYAADMRIKEARGADPDRLRHALELLSDLELDTRGGSELSDDTAALLAIDRIATPA